MTTPAPDPYGGRPPPQGYGAQISKRDGVETWRNLICEKCAALVPDDAALVQRHDAYHHAEQIIREAMDKMIDELDELKKRYTIQEEP